MAPLFNHIALYDADGRTVCSFVRWKAMGRWTCGLGAKRDEAALLYQSIHFTAQPEIASTSAHYQPSPGTSPLRLTRTSRVSSSPGENAVPQGIDTTSYQCSAFAQASNRVSPAVVCP